MSEAKFTKGEWERLANNCDDLMMSFYGVKIGKCYVPVSTENSGYDAHLISCAPEMYEFIETYMGGHPEAEKLLEKCRGEQ